MTTSTPEPATGTFPGIALVSAPRIKSCTRIAVVNRMPQAAGKLALTTEASGNTRSMQRNMPALMWIASDWVTT